MRAVLSILVALTLAGALSAEGFPEEGVILMGGEQLMVMLGNIRVRSVPNQALRPMPPFSEIESKKRKPGWVQGERRRRHERDNELEKLQGGTILKGVGTEVLYGKGRDHAEKSKASSQAGQGSKSIGRALLGGLFK
jgi:hypothetical protein